MTLINRSPSDAPSEGSIRTWITNSIDEMEVIYAIRHEVFVSEQGLTRSVNDDPDDRYSIHVVAARNDRIVGAGRVTFIGDEAQIAWVAVRENARGLGVGNHIMEHLIAASRDYGSRVISLNAQTHALHFYERLGFRSAGRRFHMSNIEHQHMVMDVE